jgi:MtN3 and saliva related transmembrane protein
MSPQILGFIAGGLGVFAALPQIIKIIKTKKTRDISFSMYVIQNIATAIWLTFGIITNQISLIIINIIFQILNLTILILKIKNG